MAAVITGMKERGSPAAQDRGDPLWSRMHLYSHDLSSLSIDGFRFRETDDCGCIEVQSINREAMMLSLSEHLHAKP